VPADFHLASLYTGPPTMEEVSDHLIKRAP
jgi:hypothetical protein